MKQILINSYNKAPLPFLGQKRNFLKEYKNALIDNFKDFDGVVLDLFGGSGLLSHHAKQILNAETIWNDFDNYQERLDHIEDTNILKEQIANIIKDYEKERKLSNEIKQVIINLLEEKESGENYIDFITLSTFILFGGNYGHNLEDFKKATFYKNVGLNAKLYNANGYLDRVKRVSMDYKELLEQTKDKDRLLILDPPYIYSNVTGYKGLRWTIKDLMELIDLVHKDNFILFGSSVSGK